MSDLTKAQRTERDESIVWLKAHLPIGSTVYTVLRHVSRSKMLRVISLMTYSETDHRMVWLDYHAERAMGWTFHRDRNGNREGLRVGGYGMDMGFHLVHTLSGSLYGYEDLELPEDQLPEHMRGSWRSKSGAYALKHEWL